MLLTRALVLQSLLPEWGCRSSHFLIQRAYNSTSTTYTPKTKPSRPKPQKERGLTSLFDELFPEDAKKKETKKEIDDLEKLPAFQWSAWPDEERQIRSRDWETRRPMNNDTGSPTPQDHDRTKVAPSVSDREREMRHRRNASVLVLNCASTTLEETDFFRLGPRGQHIQGWTSGIMKIIQGRDTLTLEPLGHYFILFSSQAAAEAYLDHILRLHALARTTTGSLRAILTPPTGLLRDGESPKDALRAFSLVPGHCKLSIRLARKPYKDSFLTLLENGGPLAMKDSQAKSEAMVLLSLDVGRVSRFDLQGAIGDDGRRRNLHWNIVEDGIVSLDKHGSAGKQKGGWEMPSRYLLSFAETDEARRFVREWHRREYPGERWSSKMTHYDQGEERPPRVSAHIIW